jgi:hypothetical protein
VGNLGYKEMVVSKFLKIQRGHLFESITLRNNYSGDLVIFSFFWFSTPVT